MKNSTVKTLGVAALALIAIVALGKIKKNREQAEAVSVSTIPDTFSIKDTTSDLDLSTKYSFQDGKYYSQLMGPTVKSKPSEITKEEYLKAYNSYLA